MPLTRFIDALKGNNWLKVKEVIDEIDAADLWPEAVASMCQLNNPHLLIQTGFHSYWTERGFRVRAAVANDAIMIDALRILLPVYQGLGQSLYRGENLDRWLANNIGFGWSLDREIGRMFGEGLAASEGTGGILLSADAPREAIIAGPNAHSETLGESEFIVDPRLLQNIREIERYPRIY